MFLTLKKHWLLVLLSFVLGVLVVVKLALLPFLSGQEPTNVSFPKPSLVPIPEAPQGLSFSFTKDLPSFPKTLPTYKVIQTPTISLSEAKKLAASFGFTGEPQITNDIDNGVFYNWADENKHLSLGGKPPIIIFGQPSLKENDNGAVVMPEKTAAQAAEKILKEKGLDSPFLDLSNPQIALQKDPQIIKVDYSYKINSFPLLGNIPSSPAVFLLLNPKGELLRLIYTKYPANFEKSREIKISQNEEIKKQLANNEGAVLYSLSDEDLESESAQNYQVGLVKINQSYLAYYYPPATEETNLIIQPVFVFEGTGVDQTSGKTVNLIIYLPATAGP